MATLIKSLLSTDLLNSLFLLRTQAAWALLGYLLPRALPGEGVPLRLPATPGHTTQGSLPPALISMETGPQRAREKSFTVTALRGGAEQKGARITLNLSNYSIQASTTLPPAQPPRRRLGFLLCQPCFLQQHYTANREPLRRKHRGVPFLGWGPGEGRKQTA